MPYTGEQIRAATHELINRNQLRSCYIRPLAFRGYGEMGLYAPTAPVEMMVAVWPWGAYLGEEGKSHGVRARVSSWRRISPAGLIPHAKASGQYLNSILAKTEVAKAGYDEAILLDERGFVCEGSGENVFVVRDGVLVTPPHTASILDGINRKSVIQIARDLGYTVVERDIARAELYIAEEIFLTGTAAELVPVREIDDHDLGEPGEITRVIQGKFDDALHGRLDEYREWLDPVGEPTGKTPSQTAATNIAAGSTAAEVDAEEVGEPASGTLGS
jgi:branched-chain amino acid aminotransferase